jgi:hypothetical protein
MKLLKRSLYAVSGLSVGRSGVFSEIIPLVFAA